MIIPASRYIITRICSPFDTYKAKEYNFVSSGLSVLVIIPASGHIITRIYGPYDTYTLILPYSLVELIVTHHPDLSSGFVPLFIRIDILSSGLVISSPGLTFYHPDLCFITRIYETFTRIPFISSGIPKHSSGFVILHPDSTNFHPDSYYIIRI